MLQIFNYMIFPFNVLDIFLYLLVVIGNLEVHRFFPISILSGSFKKFSFFVPVVSQFQSKFLLISCFLVLISFDCEL